MDLDTRVSLRTRLNQLRAEMDSISPQEAEERLFSILIDLLNDAGYGVEHTGQFRSDDGGFDFVAAQCAPNEAEERIAIEFKYFRSNRPVGISEVRRLIGAAVMAGIDRSLLLINTRFTPDARQAVERDLPVKIELADLDSLEAWAARLNVAENVDLAEEVKVIMTAVSSRFAKMIAKSPDVLDELEWRDLERVMAEVFDGIGFSVELTPGSKDGGKDIVLQCNVEGRQCEYVVELKHWRSRQRVGGGYLRSFLKVIVREGRSGGLFLSTYGCCDNAFEQLTEIERKRLRFGNQDKIIALCQTYVKAKAGIWLSENLSEVLFDATI